MNLKFPSLMIILLVVSTMQQSCPSSLLLQSYTSSSVCNYQYQYINSTCSFKVCLLQQSTKSQTSNVGWMQCFTQCCDASKLSSGGDSLSLLRQCDDTNKYHDRLLIGLVVGITFSLIGIIVIIIVCCRMQSCPLFKYLKKMKEKATEKPDGPIQNFQENLPQIVNDITFLNLQNKTQHSQVKNYQMKSMEKLLNFNPTKNIRLMRSKCSICQDIKPDCNLTCDHYFHVKCIGLWLKDHSMCASCGTKDLRYIHIFCGECREKVEALKVNRFKARLKKAASFGCKNCGHELQIDIVSQGQ